MGTIVSGMIFGSLGLAYFVYGKKAEEYRFLAAGLLLMVYPYFVPQLWLAVVIGLILGAAPFLMNRYL